MKVRSKLALTIFVTGALTTLGVIVAVLVAFQRFEHETTYYRADAFLGRVVARYDAIVEMHARQPDEFNAFLRGLVLFEPDAQLYLLDATGRVLASTGDAKLAPGFSVALGPVVQAAANSTQPYVMGDDPERMDANAVIAARALRPASIGGGDAVAGYLYVVGHKRSLPEGGRWRVLGSTVAGPALILIVGVVALSTALAAWVIVAVTRPLRQLTDAMSQLSARGLADGDAEAASSLIPAHLPQARDEFGQLAAAFSMMLATVQRQWSSLRRLDHFRREGVSNLSHDLRSPLTATTACLETLEARWQGDAARHDDHRLVEVALRNTRNAARLVQSLGDLAQLDEPRFRMRAERIDVTELIDDIALRFGERAARRGIALQVEPPAEPAAARVDVELFERAIANLLDNALKFSRTGDRITLKVSARADGRIDVEIADTGPGIPASDLPHLFDRFYQSRQSVAPATGEGGRGLGLAIVKRIAELHGGELTVRSEPGRGTSVVLSLPLAVSRLPLSVP